MNNLLSKKLKNKKGFTLIELIVVIAILGILAAIAIPRFSGVQDRAKIKADHATAAEMVSTAKIIAAEGNLTLKAAAETAPTITVGTAAEWTHKSNVYMTIPGKTQSDTTKSFSIAYDENTKKFTVSGPSEPYVAD